ncbi:MAG: hypothetical protein H8M99_07650 [Gloeobacteraceae cyanobacterium ES-bin-144]|nr:hypothetical protein [Verrucomicrobiales bacterium]
MLSALLLAALIKLNLVVEKPMVPTAIFTVAAFIFGLLLEQPFLAVAIGAPINFGLGFLFFWLLKRTEDQGSWWVVVVGGILIFIGLSVGIRLIR